jgi:hypothetical protein
MAHEVGRRRLNLELWFQSQFSPFGNYSGQSDTETGVSPSASV